MLGMTPAIRMCALGLGVVLVLAGCRDAQPPAAMPAGAMPAADAAAADAMPADAMPAPAPSATPAAALPPGAPMHFSVDDPAIGTEVGARTPGLGLATSGRAGWLMFGPYAVLPAGRYEVAVQGVAQPGHAGPLHVDVAARKGVQVIAAVEAPPAALGSAAASGALVLLPFDLPSATRDIEVRVRVTPESKVSVSGFEIRPRS